MSYWKFYINTQALEISDFSKNDRRLGITLEPSVFNMKHYCVLSALSNVT